jgi:HSP20 family protein
MLTRGMSSGGPEADLYETEDGFTLEMNLPGYDLSHIDVNMEQGVLQISGSREDETRDDQGTYHLRERGWGRFTRSFTVPHTIDPSKVDAEFKHGVLTVTLPKAAEARTRKIEVKGS